MSHPNAFLAPKGRLQLARCVVDDGWPLRRAAERFQVSVPTAAHLGWPLPCTRRGRDGGPLQQAPCFTFADPATAGAADQSRCA